MHSSIRIPDRRSFISRASICRESLLTSQCRLPPPPDPLRRRFPNPNSLAYKFRSWMMISDAHPYTRRYFKSSAAIRKELRRHIEDDYWYVIHPFSKFKMVYDACMLVFYLVILILVPFVHAFRRELEENVVVLNTLILWNTLEAAEMLVNMCIGFIREDDTVELNQRLIVLRYLRTFFVLDLLVILPHSFINCYIKFELKDPKLAYRVAIWLKHFPLLKILSRSRMSRIIDAIFEMFNVGDLSLKVVNLIFNEFLFAHWFTCMYKSFAIDFMEEHYGEGAFFSKEFELEYKSVETISEKYQFMAYVSMWQLFGLSFGNEKVENLPAKSVAIITMAISYAHVCNLINQVLHVLQTRNAPRRKYQEIISQLNAYMHLQHIPLKMQERFNYFYGKKFQKAYYKESAIMEMLSEPLRRDIKVHCGKLFVEKVKLFHGISENVIKNIVSRLRLELYLPNDSIVSFGTIGNAMYFIGLGTVSLTTKHGKEVEHLEDGDFFGAVGLIFKDLKRKANVIAVDYCEIYRLSRHDFQASIEPDPELYSRVLEASKRRLDKIIILEEKEKDYFEA